MVNEITTAANRRFCPESPLSGVGKHPAVRRNVLMVLHL
jgi:hypothetical protein